MARHSASSQTVADPPSAPVPPRQTIYSCIVRTVGYRGASLLCFGFLDVVYAISLIHPSQETRCVVTPCYTTHIAPLWVFAVLWGIAGVLCLISAFLVRDSLGFTAAIAMKVLWALLFLGGWFADVEWPYVSAVIWLTLAGFLGVLSSWPDPIKGRP